MCISFDSGWGWVGVLSQRQHDPFFVFWQPEIINLHGDCRQNVHVCKCDSSLLSWETKTSGHQNSSLFERKKQIKLSVTLDAFADLCLNTEYISLQRFHHVRVHRGSCLGSLFPPQGWWGPSTYYFTILFFFFFFALESLWNENKVTLVIFFFSLLCPSPPPLFPPFLCFFKLWDV